MHPADVWRPGRARLARLTLALALGSQMAAQEPPPAEHPEKESFQVVVNAQNPATELSANRVARMFLKRVKRWDHGVRVTPIDLGLNSKAREAFTETVHRKSVTAIKSFWQRMIFSGRDAPPEEMRSEQEILEFVRTHPGAIGYVAADTPLGNGVKELDVIP